MQPNKLYQTPEQIHAANQLANIQGMRKDANINASNTQGILEEIRDKEFPEIPEFPTEIATKTEIVGNRDDVASAFFSMLRGDTGEPGHTPTDEELLSLIMPLIPDPIEGEPGHTPTDNELLSLIRPLIPRLTQPKDGHTPTPEELLKLIRPLIPEMPKAIPGKPGKDGSPDSPDEIVDKVNESDKKINTDKVKGLQEVISEVDKIGRTPRAVGGGGTRKLSELPDVKITSPSDNQSLTYDSASGKWVNETVSGGGSGVVETIVAGTNIDVDATDPANPIVSVETLTLADISDVTASVTEVNYIDGVTSAIQTQLDAKQPLDAQLTDVAGLTPTDNGVIIGNGLNFVVESGATLKTSLGLTIGTDIQAYDADLTTWAGITPGTGIGTALAVNVGTDGAPVIKGGALGTPTSGVLTNATGLPTAGLVDASVTLAKMANLAQDQFIGRTTASTGVPETATITAAARTVLDDTTVGAMVDTLGGGASTGTGVLVRTGSPTLTTPVLTGLPTGTGVSAASTASTLVARDASKNIFGNNIVGDYTTTATAAGSTTLTVASTYQQFFTGSTTQTVVLPVTSTLTLGHTFFIANNSTGAVTVNSSGGNAVIVIAAGAWAEVTCILVTGTTAASWNTKYSATIITSAKKLSVSNTLTLAGTDGTTMTFPSTSATIARTDAANTFTGVQTMTSPALTTPVLGTPSSGTLTNCTGLPIAGLVASTSTAIGVGSVELGHATDTTIARVSAGVVSIEGKNILTTDGGTLTGNITLGENTSIALDPAGSADGKYSGITITGTAGYAQTFGDLVYLAVADSRWEKTDADASATAGPVMIGIVVVAGAADGNACTILLQGQIRADAAFPALTVGAPVYVGETAGAIQVAIPTGADNVIRVVGFALTDSEIYFNPSPDHQITVA